MPWKKFECSFLTIFFALPLVPNNYRNKYNNNSKNNNNSSRHNNKVVGDKWAEAMTRETPDIEVCPRSSLDRMGRQIHTGSKALDSDVGTVRVLISSGKWGTVHGRHGVGIYLVCNFSRFCSYRQYRAIHKVLKQRSVPCQPALGFSDVACTVAF